MMMKNKHNIVFILISLFAFGCAVTKENTKISSKPTWQAEFNQSEFDRAKWTKIPRGASDWNRQMSSFDSLYAVRDGKLILRGIVNDVLSEDTAHWITGGLYTKGVKSFGYGRIEIRAKFEDAKGAWPAFWMLPVDAHWPHGGEIDIMERLNDDTIVYQTIHSPYTLNLGIKDYPLSHDTAPIHPQDFNTYAVERYPDSLVFFVNGQKTFSYPKIETDKKGQFPFDQHDFYLLIDMQLGGSWVGEVDTPDLPVQMEIDWVRFYKLEKMK